MGIRYSKRYPLTHEEAVALQLQRSHLQHHVDSADANFEATERHLAQARAHTACAKLLESTIQKVTGQRPLMNVNNIPSLDRKKKTRSDDNPSSETDFKVEAPISCLQAIENRERVEELIYLPFDESSNGTVDLTVGDERWVEV
ncbi:predicted protein [Chaetoceros tenuissimus]|uniref:Uncharacterized protein n=1 Tax=Chaetoceros tenuissimus TaxID=426638 RepID=A0AAD3CVR1_9STRA|nr:predicted protein [Chaetoceros tenuissimus]